MNEDSKLINKYGVKNPFKVPENYFENFTKDLMDKLPEKEEFVEEKRIGTWQKVKPLVYLAAMFCGLIFGINLFVGKNHKQKEIISSSELPIINDEESEIIVDNTMSDDYSLYTYINDNN